MKKTPTNKKQTQPMRFCRLWGKHFERHLKTENNRNEITQPFCTQFEDTFENTQKACNFRRSKSDQTSFETKL